MIASLKKNIKKNFNPEKGILDYARHSIFNCRSIGKTLIHVY